jgi:hypothetical protein
VDESKNKPGRDWIPILLTLAILYLTLLLPAAAVIGAKPEVMGGAIGALAIALGGIVSARAWSSK